MLTHAAPAVPARGQNARLSFTFVTDGPHRAIQQARAAAGDKNVTVVGGASTGQQLLRAGLVDELEISLVPVLLGDGLRLFENLGPLPIELETPRATQVPGYTNLRYRVVK